MATAATKGAGFLPHLRTWEFLRHHRRIVAALNAARRVTGLDVIEVPFATFDNPEGFRLRVTAEDYRYVVPFDADYLDFHQAQLNYVRA